ncbi:hypothetical protein [Notoacmeibacter sp. MSK16QG-6]|uniref:hypothetical protein n=1 Tax=Notoacmeibacter sp. MSK16QG-6 TaxID=2957982 RepID=UPI00209FCFA5|nr:hypothetical protein [Notoacmeibacter sp. MSK16QG-6]MCP1200186.1 hypothetical protein [Notoacmeibacter sp. MSK16QG-6]
MSEDSDILRYSRTQHLFALRRFLCYVFDACRNIKQFSGAFFDHLLSFAVLTVLADKALYGRDNRFAAETG